MFTHLNNELQVPHIGTFRGNKLKDCLARRGSKLSHLRMEQDRNVPLAYAAHDLAVPRVQTYPQGLPTTPRLIVSIPRCSVDMQTYQSETRAISPSW
jgi:hypothetical protein